MSKIPIFIIGINPRCGTNYLFYLLNQHPDCIPSFHIGEDFIMHYADKLLDYYKSVTSKWSPLENNKPGYFLRCLESGIVKYLDPAAKEAKFVVSKTPLPTNAHYFLDIFSSGYMIIIIRKGQDTTESFMKSFNSRFDDSARGWKNGAKCICNILNDEKLMSSGRVILVKYEDLYLNNEEILKNLFDFLQLDKDKYDYEKSSNSGVIGSSSFKGDSKKLTWKPVAKNDTFNPLNRSQNWSRFQHYRFNWIAGDYSDKLGYPLHYNSKSALYYLFNFIMAFYDFNYRILRKMLLLIQVKIK